MVKGMGFNAISVYIMWNFHELEQGKFEYENGDKNLRGFLDLAKK
jgi:beta-galactosidase